MKKKPKKRRPFAEQENPHKLVRKMAKDHTDVLQNIEFALVTAWREHPDLDDRAVAQALKAAITGSEPMDVMPNLLFRALEGTHLMRSDVSDEIWNAGLKVVLDSVHTLRRVSGG